MASDKIEPTSSLPKSSGTPCMLGQAENGNIIRAFPRALDSQMRDRRGGPPAKPPAPREPAPEARGEVVRPRNNRYREAVAALFELKGERVIDMTRDDETLSLLLEITPWTTSFVVSRFPREEKRDRLMVDIVMKILQDLEDEAILGPGTDSF